MDSNESKRLAGDDAENASLVDGVTIVHRRNSKNYSLSVLPWMISTAVLAVWVLFLLFKDVYSFPLGRFETGWKTDLAAASSQIQIEKVTFNGGPAFSDDGRMYTPNPSTIRYTGDPDEHVDKAWRDLTHVTYIILTEEEAKDAWGQRYHDFWNEDAGGYLAGIDMFHTLHCLDRIRRLLYPEYYHFQGYDNEYTKENHAIHRDHCINQIRQYIMCSGDLTPLPTVYSSGLGRYYVNSDYTHTCRNFGQIHTWILDRFNGSSAVPPEFDGH